MTGAEREELRHFMDALGEAEKQEAAPVVPDEAVEAAEHAWWAGGREAGSAGAGMEIILAAAAPFIVADTGIPAATEVDDALLREIRQRVLIGTPVERERALTRYVAAQVAAARADERAKAHALVTEAAALGISE